MVTFLLTCTCMVGIALALVLTPMLRATASGHAHDGLRLRIYSSQMQEIERDVQLGMLDPTHSESARRELQRRVLDETAASPPGPARAMQGSTRVTALAIAVALPLTAIGLYWAVGTPAAMEQPSGTPVAMPAEGHSQQTAEPLDVLAERLAKRLEREPNDGEGWALLARTYGFLDRKQDAIAAYKKAVALKPADVQLRTELSELTEAKPQAAHAGARVAGRVSLSPSIAGKVSPDDTVFVFARPDNGERMPLAMLSAKARDLPLDFVLDDSSAMTADRHLSSFKRVIVVARVSKSGQARSEPCDLEGSIGPVAVGGKAVDVSIDKAIE